MKNSLPTDHLFYGQQKKNRTTHPRRHKEKCARCELASPSQCLRHENKFPTTMKNRKREKRETVVVYKHRIINEHTGAHKKE